MKLVFLAILGLTIALDLTAPAVTQEMVDHINSLGTTWRAGLSPRTIGDVKVQLGALPTPPERRFPARVHYDVKDLPAEWDPRKEWGDRCPSLKMLRDQGGCGSCWAFGAASSITDRICIATGGRVNPIISAEELVSCCSVFHAPLQCPTDQGCNGGQVGDPWSYWHSKGVVTGGLYKDPDTCLPYSIPPCEHHTTGPRPQCADMHFSTPKCVRTCTNSSIVYDKDKQFGDRPYSVSGVKNIMQELVDHGPVEAAFSVYSDFEAYKGGVYQHHSGSFLGGHAISIIGYGTENGTPYWLIRNSWNDDWGENGYFRILRGKNECGIEGNVVAALPR